MTLRSFGIVTILFWLSHLLFLPPIKNITTEMRREIAETREMRESVPAMYKSDEALEAEHVRSVWTRVIMLFMIAAGVISGILLLIRKYQGWIMAIVLCAALFLLRIVGLLRYYPDVFGRMKVIFTIMMPLHPVPVIYNEIITPLFFIGSILFLARKSVARRLITGEKSGIG